MGAPAASRSEAALGPMRWGALGGGCRGPCRSLPFPSPSFWPTFSCCSPFMDRSSRVSHPMKAVQVKEGGSCPLSCFALVALNIGLCWLRRWLPPLASAWECKALKANSKKKQACTLPRLQHVVPPWVFPPSNITKHHKNTPTPTNNTGTRAPNSYWNVY